MLKFKASVCPSITHDMLRKRIPCIAVRDPAGWDVFRIFFPLVYIEKHNKPFPRESVYKYAVFTRNYKASLRAT